MYRFGVGVVPRSVRFSSNMSPATSRGDTHILQSQADAFQAPQQPESGRKNADFDKLKNSPSSATVHSLANMKSVESSATTLPGDAEARRLRIQKLAEKRRAERLARESANPGQIGSVPQRPQDSLSRLPDLQSRIDALVTRRRAEKLTDPETATVVASETRYSETSPHQRRQGHLPSNDASSSPRRQPRTRPLPSAPVLTAMEASGTQDQASLSDKIMNDPGWFFYMDPPETTVDAPFTVDGDVFSQTRPHLMSIDTANITPSQKARIRESHGGDYSRFAQASNAGVAYRELDSVEQAQTVLAKRKDVSIGSRKEALAAIATLVGKGSSNLIQRA